MKLCEIFSDTPYDYDGTLPDVEINDIVYDSRLARPDTLFVCLRGTSSNGHDFAPDAYRRGCRAFAVEQVIGLPADAIQITVPYGRKALADCSAAFFGYPASRLQLIGVTGTKGKTSIAQLLYQVLNAIGIRTGAIGTNGIDFCGIHNQTINTTPESYELHKTFSQMLSHGVTCCVMEVSSLGLSMGRVEGIPFHTAVFTNLSPDHIGPKEHPSFEAYRDAKAALFRQCRYGVVNADDPYTPDMLRGADCTITSFGIKSDCDLMAQSITRWSRPDALGVEFDLMGKDAPQHVVLSMPGVFSVYNAMAVIGVCDRLGAAPRDKVIEALRDASVRGRTEIVPALPHCTVMIDYAHNALSMESLLTTLRAYRPKRLVCLFGSVGGRSQIRRKELGRIASSLADFCILTSDNPGTEDPLAIIRDIEAAFDNHCPYTVIPDREEAVRYAIRSAQEGDLIVLAGKGHEDYQLIGKERVPFCEREIAMEAAQEALCLS